MLTSTDCSDIEVDFALTNSDLILFSSLCILGCSGWISKVSEPLPIDEVRGTFVGFTVEQEEEEVVEIVVSQVLVEGDFSTILSTLAEAPSLDFSLVLRSPFVSSTTTLSSEILVSGTLTWLGLFDSFASCDESSFSELMEQFSGLSLGSGLLSSFVAFSESIFENYFSYRFPILRKCE